MTYAGGARPSPIDIDLGIDRCPYCGDLSPSRQQEVDREASALLKATGGRLEPANVPGGDG